MVWIPRDIAARYLAETTLLNAYILTPISSTALNKLKSRFEHGAALHYNPQVEFNIQHAPDEYIGKTHSYIRAMENEANRDYPFLLIDEWATTDCAVWYIDSFAAEYELDDDGTGFAAPSTDVLHEILVKASMVAWMHNDVEISSGPSEQLIHSVYKNYRTPVNNWPEIAGCEEELRAEEDEKMCILFHARAGRCVAEPGDYEECTDDEIVHNAVARLKPEVAESNGMISDWKWFHTAKEFDLGDGTVKQFPQGSIWLDVVFDTKFDWPEYKWPKGSL
ncbi:conserved hypothetical protein [Talaromyces stipitatus ATCC 10500]|uniref:Uncharacterized protein n=1 Tax=Talaromyces stipitatus (strain ATCC 10500 / CBS 375.48 / QM 6759 / NRRL 1006) TaxID=441959 RepID=B8MMK3_TALSN|nr:uncharacterized protein TSTA_100030 [Talaromyces stipitatus ATCC 10500]EED13757.1 conserved hypothetical protein [Talaromyces stipitatus ATCC 10500]